MKQAIVAARTAFMAAVFLLFTANLFASGAAGIYAIVEKVVFEPNEQAAERIQVWGAFAFTDQNQQSITAVKRGYLYFKLSSGGADLARKEWMDLKSVAGTGQAIAFGLWPYFGALADLQSDDRTGATRTPPQTLAPEPGSPVTDVRVRPAAEAPSGPAVYATNAGIVKLSPDGNHSEIVKRLTESLKR